MIKHIRTRITIDPRGKIKTGRMATNGEKSYPQSLDHFNIEKFPELQDAYGNEPKSLILYFPSDEILDFFDCNFELYKGGSKTKAGTKIRQCDGDTCIHRMTEHIGGNEYGAGEESPCVCQALPEDSKERCKYVAYLKAWIALPQTMKVENHLCYRLETHSQNSGDAIYSELSKIKILNNGALRGVPFALSVDMIGKKDDVKRVFPIWTLRAIGTVTEIRDRSLQLGRMTEQEPRQLVQATQIVSSTVDPVIEHSEKTTERFTKEILTARTKSELAKIGERIKNEVDTGGFIEEHYKDLQFTWQEKSKTLRN